MLLSENQVRLSRDSAPAETPAVGDHDSDRQRANPWHSFGFMAPQQAGISFHAVAKDDAGLLRCNSDDKRLSAEPRVKQWSAFRAAGSKTPRPCNFGSSSTFAAPPTLGGVSGRPTTVFRVATGPLHRSIPVALLLGQTDRKNSSVT
jgi:hypothetical protein